MSPWLPLCLLKGDLDMAVVMIIAAVGIAVLIAAKAAHHEKQKSEKQQRALIHQVNKRNNRNKEQVMGFVPITTGGKSTYQLQADSSHVHPIAVLWFIIFLILGTGGFMWGLIMAIEGHSVSGGIGLIVLGIVLILIAVLFITCMKVADQWDRVVVLHFGKFKAVQQPGIFWLVPFADTIAEWIDTRVHTADLLAEETLTRDTVPVDVDAVMFWLVYDPKKAALEVEDFESAVTWAAQTALRDLIGKTELAALLSGRDVLDTRLQEIIDERTEPWGVTVQSVEIREIKIPGALQDAMSREAQAERERRSRVILGESEEQIAHSFCTAAKEYEGSPTALHLRAMNMLFEGLKEKGSLMIIPSSAIDSMNLGALGGLASLGMDPKIQGGDITPAV